MRAVIIGGTGHIGTYLVPRLVETGYEVISVSRQQREPYQSHGAWKSVQTVVIDRESEEQTGTFGKKIRELKPDIVIDLICFTPESAKHLVEALDGTISHFLHCGTIWIHGPSVQVPTTETQPRKPFGEYGIQKAAIESYLLQKAQQERFPVTLLHPGHIVGPGWPPLNPQGHFDLKTFGKIARGEEILLPNMGLETVHHVHADDVAQSFMQALANWSNAVGESFHVVSSQALTLRGYTEAMAAWFGQPAKIRCLPWEEWKSHFSEEESQATRDHIAHSPNCSIEKAQRLIEYQPRYSSLQAIQEAVSWLRSNQPDLF